MPRAPKSPENRGRMQTKLSAWTPLNHPAANSKVFEERRTLLSKWFEKWSDSQRRAVLQDFTLRCSPDQLKFLSLAVSQQLPLQAADFTSLLPRALSLYIFSFLDPRSLCRSAQVSWHWRGIVELDRLWMPKCLKFGWCIGFSPTPFEQGVWKRHYIRTVMELRLSGQQTVTSTQQSLRPHYTAVHCRQEDPSGPAFHPEERPASAAQRPGGGSRLGSSRTEHQQIPLPPWRDSDRQPKDTRRFNYLDNLSSVQQGLKTSKSTGFTSRGNSSRPDNDSKKSPSEATYRLRKAKSLMFLSSNSRPQHPPPPPPPHPVHPQQASSITVESYRSLLHSAHWNAGVRLGPVRSAVPRLSVEVLRACQRSHRSSPNAPLLFSPGLTASHQTQ